MEYVNNYIFTFTGNPDMSQGFTRELTDMRVNLANTRPLMDQIGTLICSALKRNYETAGIKNGSGRALSALSEKGASGNVYEVTNTSVKLSYSPNTVPVLTILIDGRRAVVPVKRKALRWYSNGKWIFAKYSKAVAGKDLYYLNASDEEQISRLIDNYVTGGQS